MGSAGWNCPAVNGDAEQRPCGNLQVDISKARSLLGWSPVSVGEGLRRSIVGFKKL